MTTADQSVELCRRTVVKAGILGGLGLSAVKSARAQDAEIADCTTIDASGTYELGEDIDGDGSCITINASDVTIEGNGNAVLGDGNDAGIVILGSQIELRNLDVRNFETGILIPEPGAENITISGCRILSHETGINAQLGADLTIEDTTIAENEGIGVWYHLWDGVAITETTIRDNGGAGIDNQEGWSLSLADSVVANNAAGVRAVPGDRLMANEIRSNADYGVSVDPFPQPPFESPVVVEENVIVDNETNGIEVFLGEVTARRNVIEANQHGVLIAPQHENGDEWITTARVEQNRIHNNAEAGIVNETERNVDATCNWWGDDRGPIHPDNPFDDPDGDRIEGLADFLPWRRSEADQCTGGTSVFDISMDELPSEVTVGESFEIPYTVTNIGNLQGTARVELLINASVTDEAELSIEGDDASTDAFTYTPTDTDAPTIDIVLQADDSVAEEQVAVATDDDDTDVPPDSDDDVRNDTDAIPGFGVLGGAVGIGGATYLYLKRRFDQSS